MPDGAPPDAGVYVRYPFADLPRRCAPLDEAEDLVRSMAGEGDGPPPVHGVITP